MELVSISIRVSELHVGEVVGYLNKVGGWLDDMTNESSSTFIDIKVRIPVDELVKFEAWFSKISNEQGRIKAQI